MGEHAEWMIKRIRIITRSREEGSPSSPSSSPYLCLFPCSYSYLSFTSFPSSLFSLSLPLWAISVTFFASWVLVPHRQIRNHRHILPL